MFCPNCRAKIPDDAEICPICNKSTDKPVRKRFNRLKFLVIFSDYFTLVANAINIVLLITASHYAQNLEYGLFFTRIIRYNIDPAIITADIIFGILFLILPIFSSLGHYYMKKLRKFGLIMATCASGAVALCTMLYPFTLFFLTGILSPVLHFMIVQIIITSIVTVALFTYFWKRNSFIY